MTELIWDGKYVDGKRQAPVRVALPFQTIETVNESTADRSRTLELFASGAPTEWRNRLIWGDKKYVLPSLLPEFAGKVNLIYIDPPFDTGADFSYTATIPALDSEEDQDIEFVKQPSILEQKAYRDTWGVGPAERERGVTTLDKYLKWFYETAIYLYELLAEDGTLYVHCNQDKLPYLRGLLDEVFGASNHMNDIIWHFENKPKFSFSKLQPRDWECILVYARAIGKQTFHHQLVAVKAVQQQAIVGWDPVLKKRIAKRDAEGDIIYETRTEKLMGSVWTIPIVHPIAHERTGYDTQKPEPLLERVLKASSNEGDLVLDCFAGSGTTATVAEKLNRRWLTCDLGRFSIHTTRKRLLQVPNLRPFTVQNLGKYERQAWQKAQFSDEASGDDLDEQRRRERAYRDFILSLYHATPVTGHVWLHGIKSSRMVHVGAVDAPVTISDIRAIAREVWKASNGSGEARQAAADILGWEFAFELNETARQIAAESRVDVTFKRIPHEVLEKKAVEQGDIHFFELGALSVKPKQTKRELLVALTDFVIPIDDVPKDARKAIKHWSQMIDYWAVDWDFKEDTFHNQWQSYRTRQEPKLDLSAKYEYAEPGEYKVVVKVIDILGNDTTKTLDIKVK